MTSSEKVWILESFMTSRDWLGSSFSVINVVSYINCEILFLYGHIWSLRAKITVRRGNIFIWRIMWTLLTFIKTKIWPFPRELFLCLQFFDFLLFRIDHIILWPPGSTVIFFDQLLSIDGICIFRYFSQSRISSILYDACQASFCFESITFDIYGNP